MATTAAMEDQLKEVRDIFCTGIGNQVRATRLPAPTVPPRSEP